MRLQCGDVALEIDLDEGARAVSWTFRGVELLGHHGDDPVEHGMYAMAPWAGRLRDNHVAWAGQVRVLPVTYSPWALHGTCLSAPAQVVELERTDDRERLVARLAEHPTWPWPMTVDLVWDLGPGGLTTQIVVQAHREPFPVVVGWHPWFRRSLDVGPPAEWSASADAMLERGEDHLPTGARLPYDPAAGPFDDAFVVPDGRATVRWPGAVRLDIESSGRWFVVFDELAASLCVEPQSGPPNGLHVHDDYAPAVASPGRPVVLATRWVTTGEQPGDRA